jgi:PAS domain S-box-containing protein
MHETEMAGWSDRFRSWLHEASDLIQITTSDGRLCYANLAWCGVLGYSLAEIAELSFFDILHPSDRDRALTAFQTVQASGNHCDLNVSLLTKAGESIAVTGCISAQPSVDRVLEFWTRWCCVNEACHLTELQRTNQELQEALAELQIIEAELQMREEELHESCQQLEAAIQVAELERHRYEDLFNFAPDAYLVTDTSGVIQEANQAAATLLGVRQNFLLGKPLATYIDTAEKSRFYTYLGQLEHVSTRQVCEFTFAPQNQSRVPGQLTVSTIQDEVSGQVSGIRWLIQDISDRRQTELARQESEERLHLAIKAARLGIWECNLRTNQEIWSDESEALYGFSPGSFDGRTETFLECIHPDDREIVMQSAQEIIPQEGEHQLEFRVVQPNGSIRWIASRGRAIYDETGQAMRLIGVEIDITDRKQAEQDILNALETEKQLNELKSRFVGTISHEFRTPLTTIRTAIELLEHYEWSIEERQEYYQQIHTAIEHMTQLLEDVLLIGRLEAERLPFSPQELDLAAFCEHLITELNLSCLDAPSLVLIQQGAALPVWFDPKLLRQILSNLLSNAIKYSPADSTVYLDLNYQAEQVVVQVRDQGIGIAPAEQERIFEAFYRATNAESIPGTGLGLSIVKRCVELHGGHISVRSELGGGTEFTIVLPIQPISQLERPR